MRKKVYKVAIKGKCGIYVDSENYPTRAKAEKAVSDMVKKYKDDLHDIEKFNRCYEISKKDNPDDYLIFQIVSAPFYKVKPFVIITNDTYCQIGYAKSFEDARKQIFGLLKMNNQRLVDDFHSFIVGENKTYAFDKTHWGIVKCCIE